MAPLFPSFFSGRKLTGHKKRKAHTPPWPSSLEARVSMQLSSDPMAMAGEADRERNRHGTDNWTESFFFIADAERKQRGRVSIAYEFRRRKFLALEKIGLFPFKMGGKFGGNSLVLKIVRHNLSKAKSLRIPMWIGGIISNILSTNYKFKIKK
jgi:hypothetical protein